MKDNWNPTQEEFDRFLAWLDPDRDKSGTKYEEIRDKLIKFFVCRACTEAEHLADVTINRVGRRLPDIIDSYVGEREPYFYGVARHVYSEYKNDRDRTIIKLTNYLRHLRRVLRGLATDGSQQKEQCHECLEECLDKLSDDERRLILEYYKDEKRSKIDHRKEMAEREGMTPNAMRIKMCRMRERLYKCFTDCMKEK